MKEIRAFFSRFFVGEEDELGGEGCFYILIRPRKGNVTEVGGSEKGFYCF